MASRAADYMSKRKPAAFSIDAVINLLDNTILAPTGGLALLVALRAKPERFGQRATSLVKALLFFVAVKTAHRALSRLVLNNGWRRDRPKWDR